MSARSRLDRAAYSTPSADLAHLTLRQLREYKNLLQEEEERISYWRRLVQGRLDVLQAKSRAVDALTDEALRSALGATGDGQRRRLLVSVRADISEIGEMPELQSLWRSATSPDDPEHARQVIEDLNAAETTLTTWRNELHARLAEATTELIARYVQDPTLCLDLLDDPATA